MLTSTRKTITNFYKKINMRIISYRYVVWFFSVAIFLTCFTWDWTYHDGILDSKNVNWFTYVSNITLTMWTLYYTLWFFGYTFKIEIFIRAFENRYFRLINLTYVFIIFWSYGMIAFPFKLVPNTIDVMAGTWSERTYVGWLTTTILKHIILPIIIWIEFRSSKNQNLPNKFYKNYLTIIFTIVYSSILLTLTQTNLISPPYAFFDYENHPIVTVSIWFIAIGIYYYVCRYFVWVWNRNKWLET